MGGRIVRGLSIRRSLHQAAGGLPRPFWFLFAGTFVNRLGSFVLPFLALYLTLARTYVNLNQIENTKETLNRMLALEDIDTEEYINVANLYLHMNQPDEASRIIKKAISDNPSPDFAESRDLVYSVLKLGDSAAGWCTRTVRWFGWVGDGQSSPAEPVSVVLSWSAL